MNINTTSKSPIGELSIIVFDNCRELGNKVNEHLISSRCLSQEMFKMDKYSYMLPIDNTRFANGEGKIMLENSVRGKDIYILTDVGNYSCTYELYGITTHMGPDEHFQDLKRVLCAIGGYARRVSVVMPLLYSGRQHKRIKRESLDCAMGLQELERLGVKNIITFDAHDPRVENAVPMIGFTSLQPTYEMLSALLNSERNIIVDRNSLMVVSPDVEAMDKAEYYASVLGCDIGLFFRRRDYSKIVNGKNPVLQHDYMGRDVAGKDVLVVDDMISSGETMLHIIDELKQKKAKDIYIAVTYALFTEGIDKFNSCYKEGLFKKLFATNLTYIPDEVAKSPWFTTVDMSERVAAVIDATNYDEAVSTMFNVTEKIGKLIESRK